MLKKAVDRAIIRIGENFILKKEAAENAEGAVAAAGPVPAGGQSGRLFADGGGQGPSPAGRVAGPGAEPVPPCPSGRSVGRCPGDAGLPPQDQALVFPLRVSPAADRAAGRTALAGPEGGGVKRPGPLRRTLPPGVVNGVLPGEDDLRDGHKGVPLLEQGLNDGGQGLRGVQGGVVEQNDGPRLYF